MKQVKKSASVVRQNTYFLNITFLGLLLFKQKRTCGSLTIFLISDILIKPDLILPIQYKTIIAQINIIYIGQNAYITSSQVKIHLDMVQ